MRFPHALGFGGEDERHEGRVFIDAVVLSAVGRANRAFIDTVVDATAIAVKRLLAARRPGSRLWSYFPTLPDLAPDVDDLAQVAHAALACGDVELMDACEEPLRNAVQRAIAAGGAINTWIEDPAESGATRARQRAAEEQHWGRSTDPEVVANLYSAWSSWDAVAAVPLLDGAATTDGRHRIARWLVAAQGAEGAWHSTWYIGPYYGTWKVLQALAATPAPDGIASEAIRRAVEFLRETQRRDGGWGVDDAPSDPLSTSLAVLGLLGASHKVHFDASVIRTGCSYLWLNQDRDGAWACVPWIRMDLLGGRGGEVRRYLTHGSRTATSATAVMALASARRGKPSTRPSSSEVAYAVA
jgi:squalene-hopene/tetraprenyl-beta-curcumene cyclase